MKKVLFYIVLSISLASFGQNDQLAQNYFDKGEFEKALISYQDLLKTDPNSFNYFQRMIESLQQLQRFDESQKALEARFKVINYSPLLVELGYNAHLQKNESRAKSFYEQALERVRQKPTEVYSIGPVFERRSLIDYALQAYTIAKKAEPTLSVNIQMAQLYGQSGNFDMMISMFLDEAYSNPQSLIFIQNQLSRFMNEDGEAVFNESLRKSLLLRAQKGQDIFWNEFLSWYFVQQKEYAKAFIQEKAIYRRNPETFSNIVNLAQLSVEEGDQQTAREILAFVLENTKDLDLLVQSNYFLIDMRLKNAKEPDYKQLDADLTALLTEFGITPYTLSLQIQQAHLATFLLKDPERGKTILKNALTLPLNKYQVAEVKMELADAFLFEEKFNQALLYYSQIEEDLKNDAVGHQASLKAAKTSYFKSDFDWAQQQFRALKSASTQLIANDALEYFLLINDNTVADSTRTALKRFSRADYLLYQKKNSEALTAFESILSEFKGNEIEPAALLRIGQINESAGEFNKALVHFSQILESHPESIYIDEALYRSAEIHNLKLKDAEKAKAFYEKLIFAHQDSIYYIDARKKYRQLRGDSTL